jgi:hypothetical protein
MICPSCGMTIGVDCFNPQECMEITQDLASRGAQAAQQENERAYEIHARDEHIAQLKVELLSAQRATEEARGERDAAIRQRDYAEVMKYPAENRRICELEEELKEALADLAQARGEWVACSERMPERGETENSWVLAWYPLGRPRLLNWCHSGEPHWRNEQDDRCYAEVTHWRPLPTPPETSTASGV